MAELSFDSVAKPVPKAGRRAASGGASAASIAMLPAGGPPAAPRSTSAAVSLRGDSVATPGATSFGNASFDHDDAAPYDDNMATAFAGGGALESARPSAQAAPFPVPADIVLAVPPWYEPILGQSTPAALPMSMPMRSQAAEDPLPWLDTVEGAASPLPSQRVTSAVARPMTPPAEQHRKLLAELQLLNAAYASTESEIQGHRDTRRHAVAASAGRKSQAVDAEFRQREIGRRRGDEAKVYLETGLVKLRAQTLCDIEDGRQAIAARFQQQHLAALKLWEQTLGSLEAEVAEVQRCRELLKTDSLRPDALALHVLDAPTVGEKLQTSRRLARGCIDRACEVISHRVRNFVQVETSRVVTDLWAERRAARDEQRATRCQSLQSFLALQLQRRQECSVRRSAQRDVDFEQSRTMLRSGVANMLKRSHDRFVDVQRTLSASIAEVELLFNGHRDRREKMFVEKATAISQDDDAAFRAQLHESVHRGEATRIAAQAIFAAAQTPLLCRSLQSAKKVGTLQGDAQRAMQTGVTNEVDRLQAEVARRISAVHDLDGDARRDDSGSLRFTALWSAVQRVAEDTQRQRVAAATQLIALSQRLQRFVEESLSSELAVAHSDQMAAQRIQTCWDAELRKMWSDFSWCSAKAQGQASATPAGLLLQWMAGPLSAVQAAALQASDALRDVAASLASSFALLQQQDADGDRTMCDFHAQVRAALNAFSSLLSASDGYVDAVQQHSVIEAQLLAEQTVLAGQQLQLRDALATTAKCAVLMEAAARTAAEKRANATQQLNELRHEEHRLLTDHAAAMRRHPPPAQEPPIGAPSQRPAALYVAKGPIALSNAMLPSALKPVPARKFGSGEFMAAAERGDATSSSAYDADRSSQQSLIQLRTATRPAQDHSHAL